MKKELILASEIPWATIKGKDLEELLYWLLDSMGAKDLEWRIGGMGGGGTDQGRDLECSFYSPSPNGNLVKQKWWIEAKGRKKTVESSAIKEAVLNAAGNKKIDVIVLSTNTQFSNPTRDWVKEWQTGNQRPIVRLWDRTELENLCSKNPLAVIRLFGKALSPQGRLEVTKTKLWDYASFTDEPTLSKLWDVRTDLEIDSRSLVALIASEAANGDINMRQWAIFVDKEILADSLSDGLINFLYLAFRANEYGVRQAPYIDALSYIVLACCVRLGTDETTRILERVWDDAQGREYPEQVRKMIFQPVLLSLQGQISDVCTNDCRRVSTDKVLLSEEEIENYWDRLTIVEKKDTENRKILTIEAFEDPCKIGFPLSKKVLCPLFSNEKPEESILETLQVLKKVVEFRKDEYLKK